MRQQKRAKMIGRKYDFHPIGSECGLLQIVIEVGCVVDQYVQPRVLMRERIRERSNRRLRR